MEVSPTRVCTASAVLTWQLHHVATVTKRERDDRQNPRPHGQALRCYDARTCWDTVQHTTARRP